MNEIPNESTPEAEPENRDDRTQYEHMLTVSVIVPKDAAFKVAHWLTAHEFKMWGLRLALLLIPLAASIIVLMVVTPKLARWLWKLFLGLMLRVSVVVMLVAWCAAVGLLILVVWDLSNGLDVSDPYMTLTELLLVFVVIAGGWIAIWELDQTRQQISFEAMARIHEYIREVQSLGFQRPTIWRDWNAQRRYLEDEDQWAIDTHIQLSMNALLLYREAYECDFLKKKEQGWEKDAEYFIRQERTKQFWKDHGAFYPKEFQKWVNKILNPPKGP